MNTRTCPAVFRLWWRRALCYGAAALLLLFLALRPQRCAAACAEGIALWAKAVLPALFPFLVLTGLIAGLRGAGRGNAESGGRIRRGGKWSAPLRALGLSAAGAGAFLMSALSGYPVGSRTVAGLRESGAISQREAERLSTLCSTSGPMFILGTVGSGMFGGGGAGAVLLAAHLLGVLSVFFVLRFWERRRSARGRHASPARPPAGGQTKGSEPRTATASNEMSARTAAMQNRANVPSLGETMQSAVLSVLCAGGFIAAASVLLCVLEDLYLLRPLQNLLSLCLRPFGLESCAAGTASGLIEATHGCAALAGAGRTALPFAAFLITFGGASILAQQLAYLTKVGVRAGRFIAVKAAQGAAAFAFCLLLCFL